nr:SIS domain-containing protein [Candidatus Sigynarchaeota archaeon]
IKSEGQSLLARMLSFVLLADYTSTYLAFLNGTNPTPVHFIQGLKDVLAKKVDLQTDIMRAFQRFMNERKG